MQHDKSCHRRIEHSLKLASSKDLSSLSRLSTVDQSEVASSDTVLIGSERRNRAMDCYLLQLPTNQQPHGLRHLDATCMQA